MKKVLFSSISILLIFCCIITVGASGSPYPSFINDYTYTVYSKPGVTTDITPFIKKVMDNPQDYIVAICGNKNDNANDDVFFSSPGNFYFAVLYKNLPNVVFAEGTFGTTTGMIFKGTAPSYPLNQSTTGGYNINPSMISSVGDYKSVVFSSSNVYRAFLSDFYVPPSVPSSYVTNKVHVNFIVDATSPTLPPKPGDPSLPPVSSNPGGGGSGDDKCHCCPNGIPNCSNHPCTCGKGDGASSGSGGSGGSNIECPDCNGSGSSSGGSSGNCPNCNGTGSRPTCPNCNGSGNNNSSVCPECGGTGAVKPKPPTSSDSSGGSGGGSDGGGGSVEGWIPDISLDGEVPYDKEMLKWFLGFITVNSGSIVNVLLVVFGIIFGVFIVPYIIKKMVRRSGG